MSLTREELGLDPVGTTYTFEAFANPEEGDRVYIFLPDMITHLLGERLMVTVTILDQPEPKEAPPPDLSPAEEADPFF